jgi:hypothetical protein
MWRDIVHERVLHFGLQNLMEAFFRVLITYSNQKLKNSESGVNAFIMNLYEVCAMRVNC